MSFNDVGSINMSSVLTIETKFGLSKNSVLVAVLHMGSQEILSSSFGNFGVKIVLLPT